MTLALVLGLDPLPAPRPKFVSRGKFVTVYFPKPYQLFRETLSKSLAEKMSDGQERFIGPLSVEVEVVVRKPKTTKLLFPKPDIDNYLKGIFDSANGVIWEDDHQVVRVAASKRWTNPGEDPHIKLKISRL